MLNIIQEGTSSRIAQWRHETHPYPWNQREEKACANMVSNELISKKFFFFSFLQTHTPGTHRSRLAGNHYHSIWISHWSRKVIRMTNPCLSHHKVRNRVWEKRKKLTQVKTVSIQFLNSQYIHNSHNMCSQEKKKKEWFAFKTHYSQGILAFSTEPLLAR